MKIPKEWFDQFEEAKNSIMGYFDPSQVNSYEEIILPFGFHSFSESDVPKAKKFLKTLGLRELVQLSKQIGLENVFYSKSLLIEEILDFLLMRHSKKLDP